MNEFDANQPFTVTSKAVLLVSAWDAVDAGEPLTADQQRALQEDAFNQSMAGTTKDQQKLDRKILRTVVRLSQR